MPILPRSGSRTMHRHRKLWSNSSLDGCLKLKIWQPWGFTPDITCLMIPSLPAASIACSTTKIEHWLAAYSTPCASASELTSSDNNFSAYSLRSDLETSLSPAQDGSWSFNLNFLPAFTRQCSSSSDSFIVD